MANWERHSEERIDTVFVDYAADISITGRAAKELLTLLEYGELRGIGT